MPSAHSTEKARELVRLLDLIGKTYTFNKTVVGETAINQIKNAHDALILASDALAANVVETIWAENS